MRKFAALLASVSLLSPLAASAELATPSDVLMAVENGSKNLPLDFSVEIHGHYQDYWLSAWILGSGQETEGHSRSTAKITVDFASNDNTVRGKLQTRMLEKKMYLLIESVSGKLENEIAKAIVEVTGKRWIVSDVAETEADAIADGMERDMLADALRVDSVQTDSVGNTLYTLTLTRDAAREMSKSLREMASGYVENGVTPRTNITLKITLDRNDMLIKAAADVTVETGPAGLNATFAVTRRSSNVSVTAPANAVDALSLYNGIFQPMMPEWEMPQEFDEDQDWNMELNSDWENAWEMPAVEPSAPTCTLSDMRLGNCTVERVSRRQLRSSSSSSAATLPEGTRIPDFSDADYYRGSPQAAVTLVEYGDLQCPFCARYQDTLNQALSDYDGRINMVFRHYPLSFHNNANMMAHAAECVGAQSGAEGFWEFLDYIYSVNDRVADFDATDMETIAVNHGAEKIAFRSCMNEARFQSVIDSQMASGTEGGVQGTPHTVLINHRTGKRVQITGAVSYEELKKQLDAILR